MVRDPKNIAANVRRIRVERGLTQSDLASRAGITDPTVSRIERGRLEPSSTLIAKIADVLDVTTDDLLGRQKGSTRPKFRSSVQKLVAIVEDLDDAAIDDITKALKLVVSAARRTAPRR